jgi:hypothetical protein
MKRLIDRALHTQSSFKTSKHLTWHNLCNKEETTRNISREDGKLRTLLIDIAS